VQALPTILFLDSNGKIVHQFLGYKPPKEFIAEMISARGLAKKKK
jgi:thioredoxin-related protein